MKDIADRHNARQDVPFFDFFQMGLYSGLEYKIKVLQTKLPLLRKIKSFFFKRGKVSFIKLVCRKLDKDLDLALTEYKRGFGVGRTLNSAERNRQLVSYDTKNKEFATNLINELHPNLGGDFAD